MRSQIIKTQNGFVVYFGSQEYEAERNRRAFNYGFNDYVHPVYAGQPRHREFYPYREYTSDKVEPYRSWMIYGYLYAIHYYEVEDPTATPKVNAFRDSVIYRTLDFKRRPPEINQYYDPDDIRHVFLVRNPDENGDYRTVFSRMDNEPYTYTELEQYSNAGVSEWLNFCWWAKK